MPYQYWRITLRTVTGEQQDIYERVRITDRYLPLTRQKCHRIFCGLVLKQLADPRVAAVLTGRTVSGREYKAYRAIKHLLEADGQPAPHRLYIKIGGFHRKGCAERAEDLPYILQCSVEPSSLTVEQQVSVLLEVRELFRSRYPEGAADSFSIIGKEEYQACLARITEAMKEADEP